MVRMIPGAMDQENPSLNGERRVFQLLENLDMNGVALHSVWQKNQEGKPLGEIDFLLISDKGLLCIEVKGGAEISRKEGNWYSTSYTGKENKIKNPFEQAKDCMFALVKQLKNTKYSKVPIGFAVIFPECIFTGNGNDLITEVMYDCSYDGKFKDYINNVYKYWETGLKKSYGFNLQKLSEVDIENLLTLLRGDFAVIPSMATEINAIEDKVIELTIEQYTTLNSISKENERVLIKGVAGTGKSLLAIEKTRQAIALGQNVAYICFNNNMSKLARKSIGLIPENSFVGTFHKLLKNYLMDFNYEKPLLDICSDFIKSKISPQKYDIIIIDEAQDLMNLDVFMVLSQFINNGLEKGKWLIFYDPNQNIFRTDKEYNETIDYLASCHAITFPLTVNCRNTRQIAETVADITKVEAACIKKIDGPNTVSRSYTDSKNLFDQLKKTILKLITGGLKTKNIILLSKHKLCNSDIKDIKTVANLEIKEMQGIPEDNIQKNILKYYTVQSFKGLESDIVIYIDVDGFETLQDRLLNYVALSRAKTQLYVFYKEEVKDMYERILFAPKE